MKKVILLSCSTGQGHNACAMAIHAYFTEQGVACERHDALEFVSTRFATCMSKGHALMYRRAPGLFRGGYRYCQTHPGVFESSSPVSRLLASGTERLYAYLAEGGFDTVICTHVFAGMMVTALLRVHPLPIKTAFMATDYTCYPGMHACQMDHYFIPHDTFAAAYGACGATATRISSVGIPVARAFFRATDKASAKRALGLAADRVHLLVMCGSMGCGPIARIMRLLARELPESVEVSVICGNNRRLCRRLSRQYRDEKRIHVVGYTHDIPLYMEAADLYLTKPGGISVTEAAVRCLPMVFVNAVAGCEQYNLEFFTALGGAVTADTPEALATMCMRLLTDDAARAAMGQALSAYGCPDGAAALYSVLCCEEMS